MKATGGLSCVLSAGISVPEEEVAPLDARQQVLGATGWYDRSCIMAGHAPCRTAFFMPDPRRAQPGVDMAVFGARSFPHGLFERR